MSQSHQIPMADPRLGEEEKAAVEAVLDSGMLAAGEAVAAFEAEFADYCDAAHAVATTNGTTALHAALEGLGIGAGDTVLTTPFTFVATANAVRLAGADPLFADVDPSTYNLDPAAARETIAAHDGGIDAVLAVHLYGLPAALDDLAAIADAHDAPLVEDGAQAHGARHRGRPVGSVGDVGCFSFYPTKNMTTGEGGMIVTDDAGVAERVRSFIDHGRSGSRGHVRVGHNFRLPETAAAIGRVQLDRLPGYVERRREHASRLNEGLAGTDLVTPTEPSHLRHAYNQYTVRCEQREQLRDHLADAGIDTAVYYPTPVHEESAYDGVDASAPVAEQAAREVLSLPVHPQLSARDVDAVVDAVGSFEG